MMWIKNMKTGDMVDLDKVRVIWMKHFDPEFGRKTWDIMADDTSLASFSSKEEAIDCLKFLHDRFGAVTLAAFMK